MATDTTVKVRVDDAVKREAAGVLASMGLSLSDAVRMLLLRIAAEKAMPFEIKVPNAVTAQAMSEIERGKGKRFDNSTDLFKDLGI